MNAYSKLRNQLKQYIPKYKTPTAKENKELFKQLFLLREELPTTATEYDELRTRLIISNGGFAMKYALIYSKQINDQQLIEDLFQQAQIGIIEAVDRYDPYRGANFTTFAYFYIRKCIIDYIKRNKVVSVNRNIARYIKHITEIQDQLLMENNGFTPTIEEIKLFLKTERDIDLKSDVVTQLVTLIDLNSSSELSFTTDNFDTIPSQEKFENILMLQTSIERDLIDITPEELDVIKLRFGISYDRPYNLEEIKYMKSLSDETIADIIKVTQLYI